MSPAPPKIEQKSEIPRVRHVICCSYVPAVVVGSGAVVGGASNQQWRVAEPTVSILLGVMRMVRNQDQDPRAGGLVDFSVAECGKHFD